MWLRTCDTTHTACRAPSPARLPTRVIDVGSEAQPVCRLVESGGAAGQYIALSHCWGDPTTVPKTTRETLVQHCTDVPDEILSMTFRHAIQITRGLGIRYIWIDALCIVQNDHDDWAREAAKMRTVYSDAFLTIAAASASDGTGGCFHSRDGGKEYPYAGQRGSVTNIYIPLPVDHSFFDALSAGVQAHKSVQHYPLATRKWIFQERMLSRRVLYFTRYELAWECRTETACECDGADCLATPHNSGYTLAKPKSSFPNTALSVPGTHDMAAKAAFLERWAILAEEYSSRGPHRLIRCRTSLRYRRTRHLLRRHVGVRLATPTRVADSLRSRAGDSGPTHRLHRPLLVLGVFANTSDVPKVQRPRRPCTTAGVLLRGDYLHHQQTSHRRRIRTRLRTREYPRVLRARSTNHHHGPRSRSQPTGLAPSGLRLRFQCQSHAFSREASLDRLSRTPTAGGRELAAGYERVLCCSS